MTIGQAEVEAQKKAAADRALELVRPGTVVGLGSGSTARYFIAGLADRVRAGLKVRAVPTSAESRRLAEESRIAITERIDGPLDLAIDGADEIDPEVNCLKGRGGALLREKIVAHASRRFVLIADETKLVGRLGRVGVPIEFTCAARSAADRRPVSPESPSRAKAGTRLTILASEYILS